MGTTPNFGFATFGGSQGGLITDRGSQFSLHDPVIFDALFAALANHAHQGGTRLSNPTAGPTLSTTSGNGTVPAGVTLYYRIAYIDQYGLESAASLEDSVATPAPLNNPTSPVAQTSAGAGLAAGSYYYAIAWSDGAGGTTAGSPVCVITVTDTINFGRVTLTLPPLTTGAATAFIYRQAPGDPLLYYIGQTTSTSYIDSGASAVSTSVLSSQNTTLANNSVTVSLPAADTTSPGGGNTSPKTGISRWRIYVTTTSGSYDDQSLVHEVIETYSYNSTNHLAASYTDTGNVLQDGVPLEISTSFTPPGPLQAHELYGHVAQQSVPGTLAHTALALTATPLPYRDTDGAYNVATKTFTFPTTGRWRISSQVYCNPATGGIPSSSVGAFNFWAEATISGTTVHVAQDTRVQQNTQAPTLAINQQIRVSVGDTLVIYGSQGSGSSWLFGEPTGTICPISIVYEGA